MPVGRMRAQTKGNNTRFWTDQVSHGFLTCFCDGSTKIWHKAEVNQPCLKIRIVSMPCWELFDEQDQEYQERGCGTETISCACSHSMGRTIIPQYCNLIYSPTNMSRRNAPHSPSGPQGHRQEMAQRSGSFEECSEQKLPKKMHVRSF